MNKIIKIGSHKINITNEDKILFPKDNITKLDLINYYDQISSLMLPLAKNHPISMYRFPNGINNEGFYHKDAPEYFPDWIKTLDRKRQEDNKTIHYVILTNKATLIYLANFGCITPHIWLSNAKHPEYPDRIIFDLDPSDDHSFDLLKSKALVLKDIIESYKLNPFVMTTGSKGLHVTIPIKVKYDFSTIKKFADKIANEFLLTDPDHLTMQIRKEKRENRIFIDTLRNSFTATAVAPFSIRPLNGAPVAAPLYWEELSNKAMSSQSYNIFNIFHRIDKIGNSWADFSKKSRIPLIKL